MDKKFTIFTTTVYGPPFIYEIKFPYVFITSISDDRSRLNRNYKDCVFIIAADGE